MKKLKNIFNKKKIDQREYLLLLSVFLSVELLVFFFLSILKGTFSDDTMISILGGIFTVSFPILIWINLKRMRDAGRSAIEFIYYVIPLFFIAHTIFLMFQKSKTSADTKIKTQHLAVEALMEENSLTTRNNGL